MIFFPILKGDTIVVLCSLAMVKAVVHCFKLMKHMLHEMVESNLKIVYFINISRSIKSHSNNNKKLNLLHQKSSQK